MMYRKICSALGFLCLVGILLQILFMVTDTRLNETQDIYDIQKNYYNKGEEAEEEKNKQYLVREDDSEKENEKLFNMFTLNKKQRKNKKDENIDGEEDESKEEMEAIEAINELQEIENEEDSEKFQVTSKEREILESSDDILTIDMGDFTEFASLDVKKVWLSKKGLVKKSLKNNFKGYFFPLYLTNEQLTKARWHFAEAVHMARLLKRILVLPKLDRSKITALGFVDLCLIYDCDSLSDYVDFVDIDTFYEIYEDEMESVGGLDSKEAQSLVSELVFFAHDHQCGNSNMVWRVRNKENRYKEFRSLPSTFHTLCAAYSQPEGVEVDSKVDASNKVMKLLEEKSHKYLFYDKISIHGFFQGDYLKYQEYTQPSPLVLKITNLFRKKHLENEKYISFHWRLETRTESNFGLCVEKATKAVLEQMKVTGATKFYLSTDWSGSAKKSESCINCNGSDVDEGMNEFIKNTNAITFESDPGFVLPHYQTFLGVFDKLFCINSDVFIFFKGGCARRKSSFTTYIQENRIAMGKPVVII